MPDRKQTLADRRAHARTQHSIHIWSERRVKSNAAGRKNKKRKRAAKRKREREGAEKEENEEKKTQMSSWNISIMTKMKRVIALKIAFLCFCRCTLYDRPAFPLGYFALCLLSVRYIRQAFDIFVVARCCCAAAPRCRYFIVADEWWCCCGMTNCALSLHM